MLLANLKALQLYNYHQHYQNQRTNKSSGSCPSSTSGRQADQDLQSYMNDQNLQLAAFIRLQNQKLRVMLELIMEKQVLRKLEEKEREVERVKRVKRELEEKVKQMSAENQMSFNVAKQSEATVFNLRQSLVQLLLYSDRNNSNNKNNHGHDQAIEGFGETNGGDLEDEGNAQSPRRQVIKTCKGCGGGDVSVLVLPCRHLCLCKDCVSRLSYCPVCNSAKKAVLNVFFT